MLQMASASVLERKEYFVLMPAEQQLKGIVDTSMDHLQLSLRRI